MANNTLDARVIHIDLNAYEIAKNFPVDLGMVSDPRVTLAQLASHLEETLTPEQKSAVATRIQHYSATKEQETVAQLEADIPRRTAFPLHASRFMEELAVQL